MMYGEVGLIVNEGSNEPTRFNHYLINSIAEKDMVKFKNILEKIDMNGIKLQDARDCRGASLLHVAAECNNAEVVKFLVASGFDVNLKDEQGHTPLMIALKNNEFYTAGVLLKLNADFRICDTVGTSALQTVIAANPIMSVDLNIYVWLENYLKILAFILDNIDDDFSFDSKRTANHLLQFRCPLNHVVFMKNSEVMKIMIEKGSPVNVRDRFSGRTPLHLAVQYWKLDKIRILLDSGADVNICDYYKKTPCMCIYDNVTRSKPIPACEVEIVKALLERKHEFSMTKGLCFLDQISQIFCKGSKDAVRLVMMESDEDLLLAKNKNQLTLLHALAENSNPGITGLLSGKQIDVNGKSRYGYTALSHAISLDNYKMIEYLLNKSASTDFGKHNRFDVPSSFIIPNGRVRYLPTMLKSMKVLLEYGVDQDIMVGKKRETAESLNDAFEYQPFSLVKPILAQFAIRKSLGVPIPEVIYKQIQSYNKAEIHFDSCVKQLEEAKTSKIFKSMTVFELLTANNEMIPRYARDKSLVSNLSQSIDQLSPLDPYYMKCLRKRFSQISSIAESREKAEGIICQLIGKFYGSNSLVTRIIVDFLNDEDILKLL